MSTLLTHEPSTTDHGRLHEAERIVREGDETVEASEAAETSRWTRSRPRLDSGAVLEASRLISKALGGNRWSMYQVGEALATSDFQYLFGNFIGEELLERYEDAAPTWTQVAKRTTFNNFKPKRFIDMLGGRSILDPVAQGAPFPERNVSEAAYKLRIGKLGARISLYWEMIINDDLDAFRQLPDDLAIGARDTEQYTVTSMLASPNGPNATYFNAQNGNLLAGNPALSNDSLQAGLEIMLNKRDAQGRPIIVKTATLSVPPALQFQARRILAATEIRTTNPDGTETIIGGNQLTGLVQVNVDPWLPVVDESASANTAWYLTPDPNGRRPSFALGFLAGHDVPDLRKKSQQGTSIGGGSLAPEDGDFEDDGVAYRVRHILGGGAVDLTATLASKGTGQA